MDLKELITTANLADIALIRSLLDAEGVLYLAQGENFHAIGPLIEPVRFMVSESDLSRAQDLLKDLTLSYVPLSDVLDRDERD